MISSGYTNLGQAQSSCFYDENKNFVFGINNNHSHTEAVTEATMALDNCHLMTIPDGVTYLRFSALMSDIGAIKLEKGNKATD